MKISQLIEQLEYLKKRNGDNDIYLSVRDHYSTHGESAHFHYRPDREGEQKWEGTFSHDGNTTIFISLDENEGKYPKITFRKP